MHRAALFHNGSTTARMPFGKWPNVFVSSEVGSAHMFDAGSERVETSQKPPSGAAKHCVLILACVLMESPSPDADPGGAVHVVPSQYLKSHPLTCRSGAFRVSVGLHRCRKRVLASLEDSSQQEMICWKGNMCASCTTLSAGGCCSLCDQPTQQTEGEAHEFVCAICRSV